MSTGSHEEWILEHVKALADLGFPLLVARGDGLIGLQAGNRGDWFKHHVVPEDLHKWLDTFRWGFEVGTNPNGYWRKLAIGFLTLIEGTDD